MPPTAASYSALIQGMGKYYQVSYFTSGIKLYCKLNVIILLLIILPLNGKNYVTIFV